MHSTWWCAAVSSPLNRRDRVASTIPRPQRHAKYRCVVVSYNKQKQLIFCLFSSCFCSFCVGCWFSSIVVVVVVVVDGNKKKKNWFYASSLNGNDPMSRLGRTDNRVRKGFGSVATSSSSSSSYRWPLCNQLAAEAAASTTRLNISSQSVSANIEEMRK